MQARPTVIATAVALAIAACPAHAVLERMGPVDRSPTIGGFPAWFQDQTGITLEFCDPKTQAELDKGWCVLIPPGPVFPENFPNQFFNEHFYFDATNVLSDAGNGLRARLTIAVEAAFTNNAVVDGDQMTFGRMRVFIPNLPIAGDWRIITPFSDKIYPNQQAGDRIFDTSDVGIACPGTFDCTLNTAIGPFLLPSAVAGGAEVPPMPDLISAPPGTDPFYDLLVAAGGATADPGTGKQYLADPARIGPVTGSPLPNFIDSDGNSRNHNTFRIEVRVPSPNNTGAVLYTLENENNFTLGGRLMTGSIPGKVSNMRGSYKADNNGNVTALDVFAKADPTVQARLPAQPQSPPVVPALQSYDVPCAGAIGVNAAGQPVVNPPPYSAPAGTPHDMAATGPNYWVQSTPQGLPPSHVCIVDTSARNAAGQVVPAYYLRQVTDDVTITTAGFNGPNNGTMTVNATSTDPTAVLTLSGFGPAAAGSPGAAVGMGAGTGLDLAGNAATVSGLLAPPASVQVTSSKGGSSTRPIDTASGSAVMVGTPTAVSDSATMNEDCSPAAATVCAAGASLTFDLIANDSVLLNGQVVNLRQFVTNNQGTLTVTALAPRNGVATVSPDGIVTYTPNPNFNGTDAITYTVTVDGQVSNQAALNINVNPVNDLPVAGNTTVGAVVSRANQYNLISTSTDPDGNADVKDAVILTWPAQLGARPVPVNGVISYTPTSTGNFSVTYQAKDASGALSANTATGTVTVLGSEAIQIAKSIFRAAGNVGGTTSTRWTVTGTDTVREGQTLTIAYADGQIRATGAACNGTAANPSCVIGTAVVDATGAYAYDVVGTPGGLKDPTDTATWSVLPKNIRVFSTSPVLGGSQPAGIQPK